jgi:hypothetical protein
MKALKFTFLAIFLFSLSVNSFAAVDVICGCKGVIIYAGNGQVAGSGENVDEAMTQALSQCVNSRGGEKILNCQPRAAVKNPSVLCGCKVGLFDKGQVSGSGETLNKAFESAIDKCISPEVINGLYSCQIF